LKNIIETSIDFRAVLHDSLDKYLHLFKIPTVLYITLRINKKASDYRNYRLFTLSFRNEAQFRVQQYNSKKYSEGIEDQ